MILYVVDINDADRSLTVKALRKLSFSGTIKEFRTVEELGDSIYLHGALHEIPDGVIIDINQPLCFGADLLKNLRSQARVKKVPVLLFTDNGDMEDVRKCLVGGADQFYAKPTGWKAHCEQVRAMLKYINENLCPLADQQDYS